MKAMLSTVLVALGLTFGANVFAAEPAAEPVAAHAVAGKGGVAQKDGKREHHGKKGEGRHHKGHRHAHRNHHKRPAR